MWGEAETYPGAQSREALEKDENRLLQLAAVGLRRKNLEGTRAICWEGQEVKTRARATRTCGSGGTGRICAEFGMEKRRRNGQWAGTVP